MRLELSFILVDLFIYTVDEEMEGCDHELIREGRGTGGVGFRGGG